jgi:CubicO group peptidase (beta-lactamase class C family)
VQTGKRLLALLSILVLASQSFAVNVNDNVDDYVKQAMTKHQIPGMTVAVVKSGKVLKLKGYGVASVEFDVPATEHTVYQLFSVSKLFAGIAVMKLVEDGKLTLDTPVSEIIEDAPPAWKALHIRHLLTHTSGLPEMSANPRYVALAEDQKRRLTATEEIGFVAELPLKFAPGEKFSYHQSGFRMLGVIVEKLTKQTYSEFLRARVFEPLGMTAQFGGTEAAVIKRRAPTSYYRESDTLRGWIYPFSVRDYPAAGLNSSAGDLARFLLALDAGKVLKPESMHALLTPVRLNDGSEKGYGLGWTIGEHKNRKVVGHEGGGAIWVAHFPAEHLSVVVLCNLNGARADEIQYAIADLYLG